MTVVSVNVNGMNDIGKRKEVVDIFERKNRCVGRERNTPERVWYERWQI